MSLTTQEVRHVALLARLDLQPGEEEFYAQQLNGILAHIDRLVELDTEGISPTTQVIEVGDVMRDDVAAPCLSRDDALSNAPQVEDGLIAVLAIQE